MGDLKTPYDNAVISSMDTYGEVGLERPTDPNTKDAYNSGASGLTDFWEDGTQTVEMKDNVETPNSVSGMPQSPTRFYPTPASPPTPPDLTDRNPGTIDQK